MKNDLLYIGILFISLLIFINIPFAQEIQNDITNTENSDNIEPTENSENTTNIEPIENSENTTNIEPIENSENTTNIEPIENSENTTNIEPIENSENTTNIEPIENSENINNIKPENEDIVGDIDNTENNTPTSQAPKTYPKFFSDGNITYATPEAKIKLISIDKLSGLKKVFYKIDDGEYQEYTTPISINTEGVHQIVYKSIDFVENTEFENLVSFIIDDSAPETQYSLNTPIYTLDGKIFIGGNSKLELTLRATDKYSGVSSIEYSINDEENFQEYIKPITLAGSGDFKIYYRSIDNLGNIAEAKMLNLIIDSTPPEINVEFTSPLVEHNGVQYSKKNNTMSLQGFDTLSGVRTLFIKFNNNTDFQPYSEPFILSEEGKMIVEVKSLDWSGNYSETKRLEFIVDTIAPETSLEFTQE